ncbi:hypothetical protein [Sorangium sp. So ce426]|uniref:hypothetical protein n=1 Tax=Sorangium sp. So ce426 TaxID=3133312 RepID=UPI003F5C966B
MAKGTMRLEGVAQPWADSSARYRVDDLDVLLVAERGESLTVSGSILIAPGWIGPVVLGYRGFLERLRFALDPGCGPDDAWFFFSSAG